MRMMTQAAFVGIKAAGEECSEGFGAAADSDEQIYLGNVAVVDDMCEHFLGKQ